VSEIPDETVEVVTAEDAVDADDAVDAYPAEDAVDPDPLEDAVDDAAQPAAPEPAAAAPSSAEVGRALAELGGLDALDLADHPDAYQRIHAELQNALASIDDA
jgi:hypothetical protein